MLIWCPTNLEMALEHPHSVLGVFVLFVCWLQVFKEESDFLCGGSCRSDPWVLQHALQNWLDIALPWVFDTFFK